MWPDSPWDMPEDCSPSCAALEGLLVTYLDHLYQINLHYSHDKFPLSLFLCIVTQAKTGPVLLVDLLFTKNREICHHIEADYFLAEYGANLGKGKLGDRLGEDEDISVLTEKQTLGKRSRLEWTKEMVMHRGWVYTWIKWLSILTDSIIPFLFKEKNNCIRYWFSGWKAIDLIWTHKG